MKIVEQYCWRTSILFLNKVFHISMNIPYHLHTILSSSTIISQLPETEMIPTQMFPKEKKNKTELKTGIENFHKWFSGIFQGLCYSPASSAKNKIHITKTLSVFYTLSKSRPEKFTITALRLELGHTTWNWQNHKPNLKVWALFTHP